MEIKEVVKAHLEWAKKQRDICLTSGYVTFVIYYQGMIDILGDILDELEGIKSNKKNSRKGYA